MNEKVNNHFRSCHCCRLSLFHSSQEDVYHIYKHGLRRNLEMKYVTLTNDMIKLSRLANVLAANGFTVELQFSNLAITVPYQYNLNSFINRLPITNRFVVRDRQLNIELNG